MKKFFILHENLVVRKIDEMTNVHEIAGRKILLEENYFYFDYFLRMYR
jgi:hypothetical protein